MTSSDKPRDCYVADGEKIRLPLPSTQYAGEEENSSFAMKAETQIRSADPVPLLTLPVRSIDQLQTQVNLEAVSTRSAAPPRPINNRSTASIRSIDQLQTQVNLEAVSSALTAPYYAINNWSIDQQTTLIIPAIPVRENSSTLKLEAHLSNGEGYVSHIRELVKNSGIYALSTLAAPFVSLVLAPFLTRSLSHNDYGALAILITVIALVAGVTQLGLSSAFFRAYTFDYESQRDRLGVLSTTILLLLFTTIPTAIFGIAAASWLAVLIFNNSSFAEPVRFAALVIVVQNLTVPGLAWLRAESRATLFSILSIVNLLVNASTTVFFVGVLHMGIDGALLASAIGYSCIVVSTIPGMLLRAGVHLRLDISKILITFGFPHVVNLLSGWVLQLSDRYLLGQFGSLSQAASYSVAYSLGGVTSALIIAPFSLAWWSLMYSIAKRDDAALVFQQIFRWFSFVLLFATYGLSMFGIVVLNLFFPPSYQASAPIIPIIAASIMFNGVYAVISVGISIQRKTWYAAAMITFAALLNFGLNMFLIPLYGAMGAAVSTLIAYFVLALITYFLNQRIYPVPFEIGLFTVALLLGTTLYLGSVFFAHTQKIYLGWGIQILSLLLYGMCLLLLAKLPTRKYIKNKQRRPLSHEGRTV
jgi:O-antigen/teichoic acid export membrane protein